MRILIAILLFIATETYCQKLVLVDSLNGKTVKVKEGKLLGVITAKDTIDPYFYSDSTYERGTAGYRPDGIWKLNKIDVNNHTVQLKPTDKGFMTTYPIEEIKYFQYRLEKDSRYRESLFWIGAVGFSIGGIVSLFDKEVSVGSKAAFLAVGSLSTAWIFGTRNRTETRKYRFVKTEH